MATEEQKKRMWDMALGTNDLLHRRAALLLTITFEMQRDDPDQVGLILEQSKALDAEFEAARKELDDYRNSVKADAGE